VGEKDTGQSANSFSWKKRRTGASSAWKGPKQGRGKVTAEVTGGRFYIQKEGKNCKLCPCRKGHCPTEQEGKKKKGKILEGEKGIYIQRREKREMGW